MFTTLLNSYYLSTFKPRKERKKRRKSWRPEWDLNPVLKCKHTLYCSEQKREKAHMRKPQSCKLQYLQNEGRFGSISLMGQTGPSDFLAVIVSHEITGTVLIDLQLAQVLERLDSQVQGAKSNLIWFHGEGLHMLTCICRCYTAPENMLHY